MNEQETISLLKEACQHFYDSDIDAYRFCLEKARAYVDALPERGGLYGEWLLAASLSDVHNLDALCEKYREARQYIAGFSRVLPRRAELFGEYYNPLALCNPAPGHAEENARKLTDAVKLFSSLTGGGMGTDLCYRAQLALYRGDAAEALPLAREAFETAEKNEQGLTALCAADTMAQIAKHEQDSKLWNYACSYIRSVAEGVRPASRVCREQAQIADASISLSIGVIKPLPEFMTEEIKAVSAPWGYRIYGDDIRCGSLPNIMMVQIEHHCYGGFPVKALSLADILQKVYGESNLVTDAYLYFLRALCYEKLADMTQRKAALLRAMETIVPDGLYRIAAEFSYVFNESFYEAAGQTDPGASETIRRIGRGYYDKLSVFRREILKNAPRVLTAREEEIVQLIAEGRTNEEIAVRLSISEHTAKRHRMNIYAKLGVSRDIYVSEAAKRRQGVKAAPWINNRR